MRGIRRLRAILLNGLVWGGTWFVGITIMVTLARIFDPPPPGTVPEAGEGWFLAASGGLLLFLGGCAFATVVTFLLRGRKLHELSWQRFGLGGGVIAGIVFPAFISMMRMFAGNPMLEVTKILSTLLFGFIGGSVLAAGTLKLAQVADWMGAPESESAPGLIESGRAAPRMSSDAEKVKESA
jgi:hypothetical protein